MINGFRSPKKSNKKFNEKTHILSGQQPYSWNPHRPVLFLGLFACFLIVGPFYWMSVATMLSIVVLVASGVNLFQYCKLKQAGCMKNDLEHQILYILQYKSSLYWGYISIYIAVIPGIVLFIIYAAVLWSCIIVGIVLLLTILDVFIFRHLFRKVGQLLEANQELKRMEAIIENQ